MGLPGKGLMGRFGIAHPYHQKSPAHLCLHAQEGTRLISPQTGFRSVIQEVEENAAQCGREKLGLLGQKNLIVHRDAMGGSRLLLLSKIALMRLSEQQGRKRIF
mgnify:CR=1 FL=1